MQDEKIKVRITESDQVIEVVVLSKRMERIEVVLGPASTTSGASCCRRVMARPTRAASRAASWFTSELPPR